MIVCEVSGTCYKPDLGQFFPYYLVPTFCQSSRSDDAAGTIYQCHLGLCPSILQIFMYSQSLVYHFQSKGSWIFFGKRLGELLVFTHIIAFQCPSFWEIRPSFRQIVLGLKTGPGPESRQSIMNF